MLKNKDKLEGRFILVPYYKATQNLLFDLQALPKTNFLFQRLKTFSILFKQALNKEISI